MKIGTMLNYRRMRDNWFIYEDILRLIERIVHAEGPLPAKTIGRRLRELYGNTIYLLEDGRWVPWRVDGRLVNKVVWVVRFYEPYQTRLKSCQLHGKGAFYLPEQTPLEHTELDGVTHDAVRHQPPIRTRPLGLPASRGSDLHARQLKTPIQRNTLPRTQARERQRDFSGLLDLIESILVDGKWRHPTSLTREINQRGHVGVTPDLVEQVLKEFEGARYQHNEETGHFQMLLDYRAALLRSRRN